LRQLRKNDGLLQKKMTWKQLQQWFGIAEKYDIIKQTLSQ